MFREELASLSLKRNTVKTVSPRDDDSLRGMPRPFYFSLTYPSLRLLPPCHLALCSLPSLSAQLPPRILVYCLRRMLRKCARERINFRKHGGIGRDNSVFSAARETEFVASERRVCFVLFFREQEICFVLLQVFITIHQYNRDPEFVHIQHCQRPLLIATRTAVLATRENKKTLE